MKKLVQKNILAFAAAAFATVALVHQAAATVSNLDDLNYWGTGSNRSALIVQWNDTKSPTALAWGFNWSSPGTTVADMLTSLAASDPRLFLRLDSNGSFGLALYGIGYQTSLATFGLTGAQDTSGASASPTFPGGIDDMNITDGATDAPASSTAAGPTNASDRYKEGWMDNGFWELFHSGTDNFSIQASNSLPTVWTSSFVGSSVALIDGGWVVFSITEADFSSNLPTSTVTAAIPEPGSIGLLFMGAAWGLLAIRRRRSVTA